LEYLAIVLFTNRKSVRQNRLLEGKECIDLLFTPYSPELKFIEILSLNIKIHWLSFDAYLSFSESQRMIIVRVE
jgi:hypothetical protein